MSPSVPQDGDRDPQASSRAAARVYGAAPEDPVLGRAGDDVSLDEPDEIEDDQERKVDEVPVRRLLSVAIAGFAGLLGIGLILGAQTSGPDARTPYAIVIFGVQLMLVLAWAMALRPPTPGLVAGAASAAGLIADYLAVSADEPRIWPLLLLAPVAMVVVVIGQLISKVDRLRVRDAFGTTLLIVVGVVSLATLITLTRKPTGTQAVIVCLSAVAVALVVARLTDAVFPRPRIAPQVARGATGIIVGAMFGTLGAAALGSVLVLPFTPAKGAILGLVAAGLAVLVDLAVNFTEAGRSRAGEAPTFWVARHMQGPLGSFALAAPVTYALTVFFVA